MQFHKTTTIYNTMKGVMDGWIVDQNPVLQPQKTGYNRSL